MVAMTRAAKRRLSDVVPRSPAKKKKPTVRFKKTKLSRKKSSDVKIKPLKTPRVTLLSLPAEIRNRIYYFAAEERYYESWYQPAPLIDQHHPCCCNSHDQWPINQPRSSARLFYGLTQVCCQFRREYLPIWLDSASVRIRAEAIFNFTRLFYDVHRSSLRAPKLLQISWVTSAINPYANHGRNDFISLLYLFKLAARNTSMIVEFLPHALANGDGPKDEPCGICGEEFYADPEDESDDGGCTHFEERMDDFVDSIMDENFHLTILNEFLAFRGAQWLESIRSGNIANLDYIETSNIGRSEPVVIIHWSDMDSIQEVRKDVKSDAAAVIKFLELDKFISKDHLLDFEVSFNA